MKNNKEQRRKEEERRCGGGVLRLVGLRVTIEPAAPTLNGRHLLCANLWRRRREFMALSLSTRGFWPKKWEEKMARRLSPRLIRSLLLSSHFFPPPGALRSTLARCYFASAARRLVKYSQGLFSAASTIQRVSINVSRAPGQIRRFYSPASEEAEGLRQKADQAESWPLILRGWFWAAVAIADRSKHFLIFWEIGDNFGYFQRHSEV